MTETAGTARAASAALPSAVPGQPAPYNEKYRNGQKRYDDDVCHIFLPPLFLMRMILIYILGQRNSFVNCVLYLFSLDMNTVFRHRQKIAQPYTLWKPSSGASFFSLPYEIRSIAHAAQSRQFNSNKFLPSHPKLWSPDSTHIFSCGNIHPGDALP